MTPTRAKETRRWPASHGVVVDDAEAVALRRRARRRRHSGVTLA